VVEVLLNISMGKASSASYNINYHIVWCPKFRKPILTGKLKTFVRTAGNDNRFEIIQEVSRTRK
jgi:REP element-mobilizing transposase RayT